MCSSTVTCKASGKQSAILVVKLLETQIVGGFSTEWGVGTLKPLVVRGSTGFRFLL